MTDRRETGAVPVEFVAAVGLLLLPVFIFVMTIAPVVERRTVAGRAAAEAARAFAVAEDANSGLEAAQSIVDRVNSSHPFTLSLTITGDLERGSVVTATIDVDMPLVIFPGAVEIEVAAYAATHREEIDRFRSLLP